MAARPRPVRKATRSEPAGGDRLYLACFDFEEPGEPEWDGTFQLVVEAKNAEEAFRRIRSRLRKLRTSTTLFDHPITIYLMSVIELRGSFKNGLLVNWHQTSGAPLPKAKLMSAIPEQEDSEVRVYGDRPEGEEEEEGEVTPFLDFGGQALQRAIQKARKQGDDEALNSFPRGGSPAAAQSSEEREKAKQDRIQAREAARKETQARKQRRETIATTIAELRGPVPKT